MNSGLDFKGEKRNLPAQYGGEITKMTAFLQIYNNMVCEIKKLIEKFKKGLK